MEILTKVLHLVAKQGDKVLACQQAEVLVNLADTAYGWDSLEAANCRKQVLIVNLEY